MLEKLSSARVEIAAFLSYTIFCVFFITFPKNTE
jgi:hypothetical protein